VLAQRSLEIIGETRMRVKLTKCKTLVHPGRSEKVRPEGGGDPLFRVVEDGIIVLGNPIGTEEYRRDTLSQLVEEMGRPLPALTRVNPQAAYALLQFCFNARPCYITRVSEPHLYWPAMRAFDDAINLAIAATARTTLTPEIAMIRNLPQRLGGLGLPRHFGPQSEKACLASRALTLAYITEHRQDLQSGTEKWPEIEVGDSDGSRFRAEIVIENEEIEDLDRTLPDDVQTVIAEHKYNWMSVYKHLLQKGRRHHAAWFLSGTSSGTGKWLAWRGGADGRFRFRQDEYVESLRMRLLVDPFPSPGAMRCTTCDRDVRYADAPLHALERRHDRVVDYLYTALQHVYPTAELRMEHTVHGTTAGQHIQADIFLRNGAEVTVIDVAIVDPASPSYLAKESDTKSDVATGQREADKRARWRAIGEVAGAAFVPFVVEATGRLGPAANKFFNEKLISRDGPYTARMFMQKMNFAIARWNAHMILKARGRRQGIDEERGP